MSRKNWLVLTTMLLLGICIFAYSLRDTNLQEISADLATMNWGCFLVALLCICCSLVLMVGLQARYC